METAGGSPLGAQLVGQDLASDLAVLRAARRQPIAGGIDPPPRQFVSRWAAPGP